MKVVVTGAAGFIGSHLSERLVHCGHEVHGIDAFIPYYSPELKRQNLTWLKQHPRFVLHELDLREAAVHGIVQDADIVVHLAAMPGLSASWTNFDDYMTCNLLATQRLLEAVRESQVKLQRFILGSTSSVYGKYASGDETMPTVPFSPYGVTKLAAEHLGRSYAENHNLPLVVLRFFSVYGPRQRPDMGYNKFIQALLTNSPITVFGDGKQVRGNTYIHDCVAAIEASFQAPLMETYNIGGGEMASVWDILSQLERISGRKALVNQTAARHGDQRYTMADTSRLTRHTGWTPQMPLVEGLTQQFLWQQRLLESGTKTQRRAA
ncbi:MAG: GDP-mannose 4,6-dehydratase [Gemmatales bacterium]